MSLIYTSYKMRKQLAAKRSWIPFGHAHYSYNSVYKKFKQMFDYQHVSYHELDRPEIYHSACDLNSNAEDESFHLMFKPFEEIRSLKGAHNIAMLFWEFPYLSSATHSTPKKVLPFGDPARMLRIPEEIWVGCQYTKDVFDELGYGNVHVVPAPISGWAINLSKKQRRHLAPRSLASVKFHQFCRKAKFSSLLNSLSSKRVFLTVANAGDFRKNWPSMIKAWEKSCWDRSDCVWIVKVVSDQPDEHFLKSLRNDLSRRFDEVDEHGMMLEMDNVFFVNQTLDEAEMNALYDSADFYFCGSICEGQNLPILEAMAHGVLPISPSVTSMTDFIDEKNSIVVETANWELTPAVQKRYGLPPCSLQRADFNMLAGALDEAMKIGDEAMSQKCLFASELVYEKYSSKNIFSKIKARLDLK